MTGVDVSSLTLPFDFLELAFFASGSSSDDSSFLTPLLFLLESFLTDAVVPFDFRFFGLISSSLSESFAAFLGVGFLALLSLARIALASISAFFSIATFFRDNFVVIGSSSEESSPTCAAVTLGGSFPGFFLAANGASSSESDSAILAFEVL